MSIVLGPCWDGLAGASGVQLTARLRRVQPVADPADRQEELGPLGHPLELLPQVADVDVDPARVAEALSPQIARISSWRLNSTPGWPIIVWRSSNSENVSSTGRPPTFTDRLLRSSTSGPTRSISSPSARGPARRSTARMRLRSSAGPKGLVT